MALPHMKRVAKFVTLFIQLQKNNKDQHGNPAPVYDRFNVEDAKWTMRDILAQVDDDDLVESTIKFFMIVDDDKTWEAFKWKYDQYIDRWVAYKDDYQRKIAMQIQTINKGKK